MSYLVSYYDNDMDTPAVLLDTQRFDDIAPAVGYAIRRAEMLSGDHPGILIEREVEPDNSSPIAEYAPDEGWYFNGGQEYPTAEPFDEKLEQLAFTHLLAAQFRWTLTEAQKEAIDNKEIVHIDETQASVLDKLSKLPPVDTPTGTYVLDQNPEAPVKVFMSFGPGIRAEEMERTTLDHMVKDGSHGIARWERVMVKLEEPVTVKRKNGRPYTSEYAILSYTDGRSSNGVVRRPETIAFACDEQGEIVTHDEIRSWYEVEPDFEKYASEIGGTIIRRSSDDTPPKPTPTPQVSRNSLQQPTATITKKI